MPTRLVELVPTPLREVERMILEGAHQGFQDHRGATNDPAPAGARGYSIAMFTGIVEATGVVEAITHHPDGGARLTIRAFPDGGWREPRRSTACA
jgi:hypothetical protein